MSEYILKSKEEREKHIDLSTECSLVKFSDWKNPLKRVAFYSRLGVVRDVSMMEAKICCRHLCPHNTHYAKEQGFICMNPLHVAVGTYAENSLDISPALVPLDGSTVTSVVALRLSDEMRSTVEAPTPSRQLDRFIGIRVSESLYSSFNSCLDDLNHLLLSKNLGTSITMSDQIRSLMASFVEHQQKKSNQPSATSPHSHS